MRTWLLSLVLIGCGGSTSAGDAGGTDDAGALSGPTAPLFLPEAIEGEGSFFDFPFPSELRTDEEGRQDLSTFPNARGLVRDAIEVLATEEPGSSPITAVYFRFTGPVDESSLPGRPSEVTNDDSPILLIDIDESSPDAGTLLPAYVRMQHEPTRFWAENTLVVRAVPGVHLHPGRRYAVVVREGLTSAGEAVEHDPTFEALKRGSDETPIAESYRALFERLEALGIEREPLLTATAFRVRDSVRAMEQARAFIHARELPRIEGWARRAASGRAIQLDAEFQTFSLMSGEPPFTTFGSGQIAFDEAGEPLSTRRERVRVRLSVPGDTPPSDGFPVVVYAHGTGGDHVTHTNDEGAALVDRGIAVLGYEAALHGQRAADGPDPESLVAINPIAAREMVRQTVVDAMLIFRLLSEGAFDVPGDVNEDRPIPLQRDPVLFMGHSQGAQEGGLLLAVEPTLDAAFLSAGGAGSVISILERETTSGQPLSCLVAAAINEECDALTEDHPAVMLLVQGLLDPADPVAFAHRFVVERPAGWSALHVALSAGELDVLTPPRSTEAMAAWAGLPVVTPAVSFSDPLQLLGSPTVDPPVTGNLSTPDGDAVTGGLLQWPGEGHFAIYRLADAERRYVEFFASAAAGSASIVAAP